MLECISQSQKCDTWSESVIFMGLVGSAECEELPPGKGREQKVSGVVDPCLNYRSSALSSFIIQPLLKIFLKTSLKIIDTSAFYQLSPVLYSGSSSQILE